MFSTTHTSRPRVSSRSSRAHHASAACGSSVSEGKSWCARVPCGRWQAVAEKKHETATGWPRWEALAQPGCKQHN